jgi:type II secretory pathway pseudopilin PulG
MLEALVVLAIIAMLTALIYPVFGNLKRHMNVFTSMRQLRDIHVGVELYRQEYGGVDVFTSYKSFYTLAIPLPEMTLPFNPHLPGIDHRSNTWVSPCGNRNPLLADRELTVFGGFHGWFQYAPLMYDPRVLDGPGSDLRFFYLDYIQRYRSNIVLVVDTNCNPRGTKLMAPLTKKRGIALLLSGQVVNKYATGDASMLQWYSDPPD